MGTGEDPSERPRASGATRFARAVERRWSELLGQALVLSPRDWACIAGWHARGVPLGLVLELMDEAVSSRRRGRRPPRLSSLEAAVDEAWSVVLDGRRGRATAQDPGLPAPDEAWRRVLREQPADGALARLLGELLARLERGHASETLDAELDARLADVVAPQEREAVEREVSTELQPYRGRIDAERLERTRRRAVTERLRRKLRLPRLAPPAEAT